MHTNTCPPPLGAARSNSVLAHQRQQQQTKKRKKITAAQATANAFFSSTLTWLLWSLYGVLAGSLFVDIFYPHEWRASEHRLLRSLGYCTRPIGAVFFGHLGDTWGRTKTLSVCLCVMSLASACIGLLPTEHTWGWGSWYLLLSLHALQGLAVGGQYGGCLLLAYEFCRHDRNKGLVSALPQAGRALGFMLSSLITASLHEDTPSPSDADNGGDVLNLHEKDVRWRLAHALAIGLFLLALHLRFRIPEPPEFQQLQKHRRLRSFPLGQALKTQIANILWALGALWLDGVVQVMVVGWGLPSLLKAHGVSMDTLLSSLSIATLVQAVFTVVGGWLGDRVGRRKLFFVASMSMAVGTVFYFHALFQLSSPTNVNPIYVANILYLGVAYGTLQGAFPALLVEVFPENVRYSGVSFVYYLSRVYSSGVWPYVSQALLAAGKGSKFKFLALEDGENPVGLVLYVSLVSFFAAVSVLMIQIYSSGGRGGGPLPFRVTARRSKVREYVGGGIQQQLQMKEMGKRMGGGEEGGEEVEEGGELGGEELVRQGSWMRRDRRREERRGMGGAGQEEEEEEEEQKYYQEGEGEGEDEDEENYDDIDDSYCDEEEEEEEDDYDDSASSVYSDFDEERQQQQYQQQQQLQQQHQSQRGDVDARQR